MDNLQQCQTIINQWQQDYQRLHDILSDEQLALEKRSFDLLELATQEKNKTVNQINAHELPPILNHNSSIINSLPEFKLHCFSNLKLKSSWEDLMELVEKCSFKNEVNGRLINLLSQSSRRTFNLIKGFDPDNNIYNATGNRTAVRHYGNSLSA
jgi:flagellar biosynthesis/type III secretory pathway chaperone